MRRIFGFSIGAVVLALGACAAAGDEPGESAPPPTVDGGDASAFPADGVDAAPDVVQDADTFSPTCSPGGWCTTRILSETAFTFTDVWPLEKSAFATGFPTGRTVDGTIVEYDGEAWRPLARLSNARTVWAPSEDEVWAGGDSNAGGALKRGVRSDGTWTWSNVLPAEKHISNIWGSGPNDVYVVAVDAWTGNPDDCVNCSQRVYHLGASGTPSLVLEGDALSGPWGRHAPEGPTGLWIDRVVGTSSNDVWIVGHRGWCAYLALKTAASFVTLADATPGDWPALASDGGIASPCTPVEEAHAWSGFFFRDWVQAASSAPGEIVIALPADYERKYRGVHRVKSTPGDGLVITAGATLAELTSAVGSGNGNPHQLRRPTAIWSPSAGDVYVAGFGAILRNPASFDDASTFSYSSVALDGSALDKQFFAIRGTAPKNVWVVGESYALHKTTP